jgi:TolC family type I secretion outer membrane protein
MLKPTGAAKFGSTASLAVILFSSVAVLPAHSETLADALASAYTNNPTLLAQRAALRATDENLSQALSGWRPTVALSGSWGQKRVESRTSGDVSLGQRTAQLSVDQPLYSGGRTVSATEQADSLISAGRAQLASVEQNILLSVATGFMNLLRDQAVLELNINNVNVLKKQLAATRDRFEVGEITRTDVAQAEARVAGAVSQQVQSDGNLKLARAAYKSVVGQAPGRLEKPLPLENMPQSEPVALELALQNNPGLQTAQHNEAASNHAIRTAWGALLPTVALSGDLTKAEDAASRGSSTDSAFIGVSVSIPLYQAGGAYSSLRQSRYSNSQQRILVERAHRDLREQVTQAWERLTTARATKVARTAQVRAARIALEGVQQELAVGSRTTLDVLDSEQELLDGQVALVVAERDEFVASFDLVAAMGGLTARSLGLAVNLYDPGRSYGRARSTLFGAKVEE